MATYTRPDGESFFAVSLEHKVSLENKDSVPQTIARDVAILVDTSASQTGAFRDDSFKALTSLLELLPADNRVQLSAVDLNVVPLTEGFSAANSQHVSDAVAKLNRRTPLGTTNIVGRLMDAADMFAKQSKHARHIVYIGDGVTLANAIETHEFEALIQKLTRKRVSVTSFAIGPGRDVQLLATIANHTGGNLVLDGNDFPAEKAGQLLAQTVRGHVYWPVDVELPKTLAEAYPRTVPPAAE